MTDYAKQMEDLYRKMNGEKMFAPKMVCPGNYQKPCQLCRLCKEILFNVRDYPKAGPNGTPPAHPLRKRASELNAKKRYYSNIIFMTNPTEVVVFEFGDEIFKQIFPYQMDPDSQLKGFWHPKEGVNLFINKTMQGTQPKYYIEPQIGVRTAIPDPGVLTKMVDLEKILDLQTAGTIKTFPQSQLEVKKTLVRWLPSWLGAKFPQVFFKMLEYHYNVSEDEFKAIQEGLLNPFTGAGTIAQQEKQAAPQAKAEVSIFTPPTGTGSASVGVAADPFGEWGTGAAPVAAPIGCGTDAPQVPVTEVVATNQVDTVGGTGDQEDTPLCWGEYDPTNPECTGACTVDGWGELCLKATNDKKAKVEAESKRRSARKVTK